MQTRTTRPFEAGDTESRSLERLRLYASHPQRLDALTRDFLVIHGYVDLFAVPIESDLPGDGGAGVRSHIARIESQQVLLWMPTGSDLAVIAVGGLDAELEPLAQDLTNGPLNEAGASYLDSWIKALGEAAFGPTPAWSDLAGAADAHRDLEAGTRLDGSSTIGWVRTIEGALKLEAKGIESPLPANVAIPLAGALSLVAERATRVQVVGTAAAASDDLIDAGLALFYECVLAGLAANRQAGDAAAAERHAARGAINRRTMAGALGGLAAVIDQRPRTMSPSGETSPLLAAFGQACAALDIQFDSHRHLDSTMTIETLTREAGIGCRTILLRDRWWRSGHGTLIGRRIESDDPIVLLRDRGKRYRLIDPFRGTETLVDRRIASSIAASATLLYAPLPATTHRLWDLIRFGVRGNGRDMATVSVVGLASAVLASLMPIGTGLLFDTIVPRADKNQTAVVVAAMAAAAIGAASFDLTRAIALLRVEARMEALLQPALMLRLLALPVRFFRGYSSGDLVDRVLALPRIRRLVAGTTIISLLSLLFSFTSLIVIFCYSATLAATALGLVSIGVVATAAFSSLQLRPQRLVTALGGRENALIVQLFQGIAKLRTTASESRLFAVWADLFARKKTLTLQGQKWSNARNVFFGLYPTIAALLLFLTVAHLAGLDEGVLDQSSFGGGSSHPPGNAGLALGDFLAINAAFGQLLAAMTSTAGALTGLLEAVPLFERVRPVLQAVPECYSGGLDPGPLVGAIEISRMSFRYGPDEPLVLDELSLRIEPGQFLAIVGASGSGKSTLLRLLLGFDSPVSGEIFYQGHPVGTLDPTALRRRIGVVLQNGRITTGSIFDNITAGLPYTPDAAWDAARLAGLAEDIEAMPMGMHTLLMEGAATLSGGQMQRLMIARALVGKPEVLMFDEATSALDNRAQAVVTASLNRLGATRLVVAHRLSTITKADRIVVLDHGRIVEQGSFAELMALDGLFRSLARRQLL